MRISIIIITFLASIPGSFFVFPFIDSQNWPTLAESLTFGLYFGIIIYTVLKVEEKLNLQNKKIGVTTGLFLVVGLLLFPLLTELIINGDLPFFQ